jgi:hypothetical protein
MTASAKREFKCSLAGYESAFDIFAFLEARCIVKLYRSNILDYFAVAGMMGFF